MGHISIVLILALFILGCDAPSQMQETVKAVPEPNLVAQNTENEAVSTMKSRFAFGFCDKYDASPKVNDDLADEFYAAFPKELIEAKGAENADLTQDEIDLLAKELTCAAALTAVPDVPESALALFQSKKHGTGLMQAVTKLAASKSPYAKAARDFKDRMQSYIDGPGE